MDNKNTDLGKLQEKFYRNMNQKMEEDKKIEELSNKMTPWLIVYIIGAAVVVGVLIVNLK